MRVSRIWGIFRCFQLRVGNFDALHVRIKLRIASPPVSFPARVVVQKALYRFVGTCERSMRVRVVGVAFLFPGRERANGSCDNFDAYA